jgi:hypothetical protein
VQSKHIYQESTIVRFPEKNCNYHILSKNKQYPETLVTFSGNLLERCAYFDLASGFSQSVEEYGEGRGRYCVIDFGGLKFVSKESLPPNTVNSFLPAVLVISNKDNKKDWITAISKINIHLNLPQPEAKAEGDYFMHLPTYRYIAINTNVPVQLGKFPLFMTNCPSLEKIAEIYRQFMQYNPKNKLITQYFKSYNLCHLRAHFVYALLNSYGIQTFKIFKCWDPDKVQYKSRFHAAALIVDNRNIAWVWDPWGDEVVGTHLFLISVKKWLSEKHEPEPTSATIANGAVINNFPDYEEINGTNFMEVGSPLGRRTLQAMFSLAVPNPPEKPISLGDNIFSLFMQDQKNKKNNKTKNPCENGLTMSVSAKVCK